MQRNTTAHIKCQHRNLSDFDFFRFGDDKVTEHKYCYHCKSHWFDGEFYTEDEWFNWINEEDDR